MIIILIRITFLENIMFSNNDLNIIIKSVNDGAKRIFENKLHKIILYGSYARGDFDNESDVDIMLLLDIPADKMNLYLDDIVKLSSRLSLFSEQCITVSIIMQDKDTYEKYINTLPFFRNVSKEGVVIYAE